MTTQRISPALLIPPYNKKPVISEEEESREPWKTNKNKYKQVICKNKVEIMNTVKRNTQCNTLWKMSFTPQHAEKHKCAAYLSEWVIYARDREEEGRSRGCWKISPNKISIVK